MKKLTHAGLCRPWDMTEEQRKEFHDKAGARLEEVLNKWFGTKDNDTLPMQGL